MGSTRYPVLRWIMLAGPLLAVGGSLLASAVPITDTSARQSSPLGSLSMQGFGSAAGSGAFHPPTTIFDANFFSDLDVLFSVDEDTPYHLDLRLSVNEDPDLGDASVFLARSQVTSGNLESALRNVTGEDDLSFDGVLQSGEEYFLRVTTGQLWDSGQVIGSSATATSGFQFSFVVPEPSTAALLGLGLVGLAATRRRRAA